MRWEPGRPLAIGGHRGAAADAPENTFAAFEMAFAAGADYVELDGQLSADGVPMVIHDATLERTTDGRRAVGSGSATDLGALDAGRWFGPSFARERIPTLQGFIRWLEAWPDRGATVEAKGRGSGPLIAAMLRASRSRERLALCSYSDDEIRTARAEAPGMPAVRITDADMSRERLLAVTLTCGATGVDVPVARLDPDMVQRLRGARLFISGGTADDAATVARCLELGLDAVNSNSPAMAVATRDDLARRDRA